jgi:hypothetical protein
MRQGIELRVFVNETEHEFGLMTVGNVGPFPRRRGSTAAEDS